MGGSYKKNRKYLAHKRFVEKNKGGGGLPSILWTKGENSKKEAAKRAFCMFAYVVYSLISECKQRVYPAQSLVAVNKKNNQNQHNPKI